MGDNYSENIKRKLKQQLNNEENNPCYKEHNMSLNCLNKNNFDSEKCQLHFENYNNCKSFWNEVRRHRRINGISPVLPPPEHRKEIKMKYMETGKF